VYENYGGVCKLVSVFTIKRHKGASASRVCGVLMVKTLNTLNLYFMRTANIPVYGNIAVYGNVLNY